MSRATSPTRTSMDLATDKPTVSEQNTEEPQLALTQENANLRKQVYIFEYIEHVKF